MKILLFANTAWYLYNFRLPLAQLLRSRGDEVILVSPTDDFGEKLVQSGFRWIAFPLLRRGMNPLQEVNTIASLVKLYRSEKPELVHHFTIKCVLYGSLAARFAGVRRIVNAITGLGFVFVGSGLAVCFLRPLVKFFYRRLLKGTRVIFQNPDDMEEFITEGLVEPSSSNLIRGSGVDLNQFTFSEESGGTPLVILPGRMLWDKGVAEFVEAARNIRKGPLPVRFVLVGDSDLENPAGVPPAQLAAWQSEGVVEWWGWRNDMVSIYQQSAVVCLPSYREGVPKTLIEAAACGRALVATDVPGCREIVRHGENGLLVKVRDAASLAGALQNLLQNPSLRTAMGKAGRKLVQNEFSVERVLAETLSVYEKLC